MPQQAAEASLAPDVSWVEGQGGGCGIVHVVGYLARLGEERIAEAQAIPTERC